MTIADFVRQYFESRRRKCEESLKYSKQEVLEPKWDEDSDCRNHDCTTNINPQIDHILKLFGLLPSDFDSRTYSDARVDEDECTNKEDTDLDGRISASDIDSFVNRSSNGSDNRNKMVLVANPERQVKQFGMSQSSRVIKLPDGTVQIETVTKDANGNIERKTTYKKGDKVYTIIKKIDKYGNEKVEENVSSDNRTREKVLEFDDGWTPGGLQTDADSNDYDYWYNKLFKKREEVPTEFPLGRRNPKDDIPELPTGRIDIPESIEQQIESILKTFGYDSVFGPLDGKNRQKGKISRQEQDVRNILDDLIRQNSPLDEAGPFTEEAKRFLESVDKHFKDHPVEKYKRRPFRKDSRGALMEEEMMDAFKGLKRSSQPRLFSAIEEKAKQELPDDETPFDRFARPDAEKSKNIVKKRGEYLNRLQKYVDSLNKSDGTYNEKLSDLSTFLSPAPSESAEMPVGKDRFRIGPNAAVSKSEMLFPDGKIRSEVLKRDREGNEERTITYKAGNKIYTVIVTKDFNGVQKRRTSAVNIASERDLNQFKDLWDDAYRSDFEK